MIRRDFLRRCAATTAGLIVAGDALELLTEPRRRVTLLMHARQDLVDPVRLYYELYRSTGDSQHLVRAVVMSERRAEWPREPSLFRLQRVTVVV